MRRFIFLVAWLASRAVYAQDSQPASAPASAPAPRPEPPASPPSLPASQPAPVIVEPAAAAPLPWLAPPPARRPVFVPSRTGLQPELHFLLQGWYDSAEGASGSFVARRAEVFVVGNLFPGRVRYALSLDPARAIGQASSANPLGDLWLSVALPSGTSLSLGQFRLPIASETFFLSSQLIFPELSPVSARFGDERDLGAKIERWDDQFSYSIGLYNGAGENQRDADAFKDVAGRLEIRPIPELTLAAAGLARLGAQGADRKDRVELDLSYRRALWALTAEAHLARDGDLPAGGVFGVLAFPVPLWDGLQLALRGSLLDRDLRPGVGDALRDLSVGANYYLLRDVARLQASASLLRGDNDQDDATQLLVGAFFHL